MKLSRNSPHWKFPSPDQGLIFLVHHGVPGNYVFPFDLPPLSPPNGVVDAGPAFLERRCSRSLSPSSTGRELVFPPRPVLLSPPSGTQIFHRLQNADLAVSFLFFPSVVRETVMLCSELRVKVFPPPPPRIPTPFFPPRSRPIPGSLERRNRSFRLRPYKAVLEGYPPPPPPPPPPQHPPPPPPPLHKAPSTHPTLVSQTLEEKPLSSSSSRPPRALPAS